jgi:hypothetical protein
MWFTLYVGAGPVSGPYYVVSVLLLFQSVILVSGGINALTDLYPRHAVVCLRHLFSRITHLFRLPQAFVDSLDAF